MTDLEFLATPDIWPKWPVCPVVHRELDPNDERCGFIHTSYPNRVYFGNVFRLPGSGKTWGEVLDAMKFREFPNQGKILEEFRID